ncbi:Endo-1,3(4)-beta-glucanase 1 [Phytophthora megakarya]|uniref:Endo-1,3(4)-beta-glucanase 1 n=1 Tax=Phytophthora megakarya TaxID=4795 RepID=A0A225VH67_9STRA|nr:Endo-1,3(4)-beta-glucanase 1 [Phytophthora megakarya]
MELMKVLSLPHINLVVFATSYVVASSSDPSVGEGYTFLKNKVEDVIETFSQSQWIDRQWILLTFPYRRASAGVVRNGSLADIVPIINVARKSLDQPIPINDWWGNLIYVTVFKNVSNYAAWSNPYAAPYGLQTCYSHTYQEIGPEVNGTVKYYNHSYHNDLTLSSEEFFAYEPTYKIYEYFSFCRIATP